MPLYYSKIDAVAGMQQRGFTDDFQLFGDTLLWVQEKIFIRMGDFAIVEYHCFSDTQRKCKEDIIFGLVSNYHNVKGILLNDYSSYTTSTPPVIVTKLNEMNLACANEEEVNLKFEILNGKTCN